jgi:hypothetical protein
MEQSLDQRHSRAKQIGFGVTLVVAGLLLAVRGLDIWHVFNLWPLFLVGLGLSKMLAACCKRETRSGVWLLALGLWFALNQFTVLGYHQTWPMLLAAIGGFMVWDALVPADRCANCARRRHDR